MKHLTTIAIATLAASGFCQATQSHLLQELKQSRSKLPPMAALYMEELRVPGGGDKKQDWVKPKDGVYNVSWGDHDSDLLYKYAFGPNSSYHSIIGDGNPLWSNMQETELCLESGRTYKIASKGSQGNFGSQMPGVINPSGAAYEIRQGESISKFLDQNEAQEEEGWLVVKKGAQTDRFHFVKIGGQTVVDEINHSYKEWSSYTQIKDWMSYKGASFPKTVLFNNQQNGVPVIRITYKFQKFLSSPESMLSFNGWQEGALVKDSDQNIHYKVVNGQLVENPIFMRPVAVKIWIKRITTLILFVLAGVVVTLRLRKKHRVLLRSATSS